jgi:predicted outer membrane repeat protein
MSAIGRSFFLLRLWRLSILVALTSLGFTASAAPAAMFRVPEEHATIVAAVAAASDGDTVLIGPGVYIEHVDTGSRWLAFIGTSGAEATVIDGGGTGRVFRLGRGGHLSGLSIINGYAGTGAGVLVTGTTDPGGTGPFAMEDCLVSSNFVGVDDAGQGGGVSIGLRVESAVIRRSRFEFNSSGDVGGGVYTQKETRFEDCIFIENTARNFGGAIWGAGTRANRCLFLRNTATYAAGAIDGSIFEIVNCTFVDNRHLNFFSFGAAIHLRNGNGRIANCIIAGSRGSTNDSGVGIYCRSTVGVRIECNTFWDNGGPDILLEDALCDTTGGGNLFLDPDFCNPDADDYTVSSASPCAGKGPCGPIGAYGIGCEAIAIQPSTWSRIKNLVR